MSHHQRLWWYGDHMHQTAYIAHLEAGGRHPIAVESIRSALADLEVVEPHRESLSQEERDSLDYSLARMRAALWWMEDV